MNNELPIINKVANSSLVTLDLEEYYHHGERVVYDIKDNLFQGLVLKEKDFRLFVKGHDWSVYKNKNVALYCSEDAIVPTWAYMLLAIKINPFANKVVFGNLEALEQALFQQAFTKINLENYRDKKVVIKGCSNLPIPEFAYVELVSMLHPLVSSLMYGEACSTVPLYKVQK
ncbi:MAG: DUF2480 family protein [Cyclobacteriaceae bacterium]|nr:DUF2480 family protein [Cyclobacteriaceae bacterium]